MQLLAVSGITMGDRTAASTASPQDRAYFERWATFWDVANHCNALRGT